MWVLLSTRIRCRLEWGLWLGLCGLLAGCDSAGGEHRPNVVLITLDTLRPDQLSAYGHDAVGAPFLAQLASNGVVFERAYSSSSWTAPATASLLTGVYPDRHGVKEGFLVQLQDSATADEIRLQTLSRTAPTLAQVLQSGGYATFGVAANVNVGSEMGFDRGFERFVRKRQMSAKDMAALVSSWKDELSAAEPFFLYLHLNDVHKPYDLRRRWHSAGTGEPASTLALYRSELGYMDHFLQQLFVELQLGDDDLLVVVSDHGEEFLEHGNWGHHFSLYNELNQIVFFVHGPGLDILRGARVSTPVSIVDVAPTILELLGLSEGSEPDGRSQVAAVRGEGERARAGRQLFAQRAEGGVELWSVLDGWHKLIQGPEGVEYYDLEHDPGETTNLAADEPEIVERLLEVLGVQRARAAELDSNEASVPIDAELLQHLRDLGYAR